MADPFIGEIRLFSFGYAPSGWATCDGQTLTITQNAALYSLLSTMYGGDGKTTFKLPDLRGRTMISRNTTFPEGQAGGTETVALSATSQLPAHSHTLAATTTNGGTNIPSGTILAAGIDSTSAAKSAYTPTKAANTYLAPGSLTTTGNSAAHNNMQPSQTINYCIATMGMYPPRP
jgi:microcystin-dependent protein